MPRKTTKKTIKVFNEKVLAEEQYYLGNEALPTSAQYTYTPKMQAALDRCKDDICYFAETFFTIIDQTERKKIPLREYQKRILKKMQKEKRLILLTSRQCGKTTLMTIYALWLAMFFPDQSVRIIANKRDRALDDLARIHLAYQEMDNWIKTPVAEGAWNKGSIKFNNGSTITALATSASSARGDTISCILLDELGFVEDSIAQEFWRSVGPTLSSNPNAQMFIASTPKGEGNLLWDLCTKSDKGENDYIVERVYWNDIPGRDEAWKEYVLKNDCNGDINYFEQEYECRFLGSSRSPFRQEVFDKLSRIAKPPQEVLDGGKFYIWKYPENNRVYTMGVDVAEGIGGDNSVIQIFDLTDLTNIEQCACFYDNHINPTDFALKVIEIAEMYGKPVMSIERNACGVEVCNKMVLDYNYPRFVNWGTCYDPKGNHSINGRYGIICSQNTKRPALTTMKFWLADRGFVKIYDDRFIDELRNFEVHPVTNKWSAAPGFHDDIIMATVWALNVLNARLVEQYFLVDRWDINNPTVPSRISNRFSYVIDPNINSQMMTLKFGSKRHSGYSYPAVLFGFEDKNYEEQERWRLAKEAGVEWSPFLYDGTPIN